MAIWVLTCQCQCLYSLVSGDNDQITRSRHILSSCPARDPGADRSRVWVRAFCQGQAALVRILGRKTIHKVSPEKWKNSQLVSKAKVKSTDGNLQSGKVPPKWIQDPHDMRGDQVWKEGAGSIWLERATGLLEEDENQDGCSDLRAHWSEV